MVQYVKTTDEFKTLMEQSKTKPVFIDFTASWCGPCRSIGPVFENLAGENPTIIFVKVDVDEADGVAASCGISAMPTFQVYKNGVKVDEMLGASKSKLKEMVAKYA